MLKSAMAVVCAIGVVWATPAHAQGVVIDSFQVPGSVTDSLGGSTTDDTQTGPTADIVGGNRWVRIGTYGGGDATATIGSGSAIFSNPPGQAQHLLYYGYDTNPISPTVDLTAGGEGTGIEIDIQQATGPATILFQIYDSTGANAVVTHDVPNPVTLADEAQTMVWAFPEFQGRFDLTDVEKISVFMNAPEGGTFQLGPITVPGPPPVPTTVSFVEQGRLLDAAGSPVNGVHELTVTLYDAPDGAQRWQQTYPDVPFTDGYYAVTLSGADDVFEGSPGSLELGLALDQGAELSPRKPLGHVPLAAVSHRTEGAVIVDVDASTVCAENGLIAFDASRESLFVCVSNGWRSIGAEVEAGLGSSASTAGRSCKAIRDAGDATGDGLYWIDPMGPIGDNPIEAYCDMTTDGGGWTLVSYSYRASSGGSTMNYLPNGNNGVYKPMVRDNFAAMDASELVRESTYAMLTTANGQFINGPISDYTLQYRYAIPSPTSTVFSLTDQSSCDSVSVTELTAGRTFSAFVQDNKVQVACSGNKGGTPYERQFLGFCNNGCWGRCGVDNTSCDGMVVHYGSGYDPAVSGGAGEAERAGSFGFWLK